MWGGPAVAPPASPVPLGGYRLAHALTPSKWAAGLLFVALTTWLLVRPVRAEPPAGPAGAGPKTGEAAHGAKLFAARCAGCHSVGQGDKVGPDLLGVLQRRSRAWLTSFIRNPSALIDAGDTTAVALLGKYNNIRMPAQDLDQASLDGLFAYLSACDTKGDVYPRMWVSAGAPTARQLTLRSAEICSAAMQNCQPVGPHVFPVTTSAGSPCLGAAPSAQI